MKENYLKLITIIERTHRSFMKVLDLELNVMNISDINSSQCLVLYKIGHKLLDFKKINRDYHMGAYFGYNLKMMTKNGYFIKELSHHDRRKTYVKLSSKGLNLYDKLDQLFQTHAKELVNEGITNEELVALWCKILHLESFWKNKLGDQ